MGVDNSDDGIDPYAAGLIRFKARQLVGKAGFTASDREDIEQELILDLLRRLPKYNPKRAQRNTFIARVVEHRLASLIEAQKAGIRDYRRCRCSLNECLEDADGRSVERVDTFDQEDYLLRTGAQSRPSEELSSARHRRGRCPRNTPPRVARAMPAPQGRDRHRDLPRHGRSARNDLRVDQEAPRDLQGRRPQELPVTAPTVPARLR